MRWSVHTSWIFDHSFYTGDGVWCHLLIHECRQHVTVFDCSEDISCCVCPVHWAPKRNGKKAPDLRCRLACSDLNGGGDRLHCEIDCILHIVVRVRNYTICSSEADAQYITKLSSQQTVFQLDDVSEFMKLCFISSEQIAKDWEFNKTYRRSS